MAWNQRSTRLEYYEEPCLIGSELLNKAVEKPEALNPKKRTPKNKRRRSWDWRILEEIKRLRDRDEHPNLELKNCIRCCWIFAILSNLNVPAPPLSKE